MRAGLGGGRGGRGSGSSPTPILRYLGDLSGGQIMKRLLAKSLGLG